MRISENKTTANLLTAMVLAGGEITSDNMRLASLAGISDRMMRWTVERLISNRYIEQKDRGGEGRYRLKLFEKMKGEYLSQLWDGAEGYEPQIYGANAKSMQRDMDLSELIFLMENASVSVTPDKAPIPEAGNEKAIIEKAIVPLFLPSREVRKAFPVDDSRERMARYHGMLVTENGVFPVYNYSRSRYDYIGSVETGAAKTAEQIRQLYLPDTDRYVAYDYKHSPAANDSRNRVITKGCLIVTDDYMKLLPFFIPEKRNETEKRVRRGTGIAALAYSYDTILAIPMKNVVTASYINMFAAELWHKRLTDLALSNEQRIPDNARGSVDIDGIADGEKTICFIDCDIRRLRNVIANADENSSYRVVCYDFQLPLLENILPDNFRPVPYTMDEVYTAYCAAL